ncbi:MAG TPA: GNAT family N-acetyltransferase [Longimicrobium sp.]|nr:GNAT family N-acetyltransferase [Longimicrobium sp.]
MEVRVLRPGDEAVLARVADGVFDHAVRPALAAEFLADPRHHIVVAVEDGVVVGFASGVDYIHPDKPAQMWVNEVGVAPSHQRRGIGRAVLRALLDHARAIGCGEAWLGTEPDNTPARRLYESLPGQPPETFVLYAWEFDEEIDAGAGAE